ncbi:PP2C family protein-serine/threonine phosphatase [Fusibacter sp. JL216-2]|uniref:PP2C family protein-serine/threonine phosphatase n=1 Tax=Fusibacter sp. JL216-2 TaxID=3071453 RepID=UPI003D33E769
MSKMDRDQIEMIRNFIMPFVVAIISMFVLMTVVLWEPSIRGFLHSMNLESVITLLEFGCIVALFLMFNTTYYAYLGSKKLRMLVYAVAFLIAACLELMMIIYLKGTLSTISMDQLPLMFLYMGVGRFIMALGMFVAVLISRDRQVGKHYRYLTRFAPIMIFIIIIALEQKTEAYVLGVLSTVNLSVASIMFEFTSILLLVIVLMYYLRIYLLEQNRNVIIALTSLVLISFSHAVRILYPTPDQLSVVVFNTYRLFGYAMFLHALFKLNIGEPGVKKETTEKQIKLYAENLEKIIDKRTSEIREVNARLIKELEYAKSIQQSLLPLKRLNFKNTTFMSEYFPCERLSGDFYDIYRIDEDNIGMYVLDVSGHGISAALMTMFCNNFIKSTERLIKRYRGLKPHRNLKHFYEEFNKMNFPEEMHMVIFFASYNISTRTLTYCTGGMNCYPILVRKSGEAEFLNQSQGFPICQMSEFFTPEYKSAKIDLMPGDRIAFYTDGLIDKFKNKVMDQDEFVEILMEHRHDSLKNLNNSIVRLIEPNAEQLEDDITYFIMET